MGLAKFRSRGRASRTGQDGMVIQKFTNNKYGKTVTVYQHGLGMPWEAHTYSIYYHMECANTNHYTKSVGRVKSLKRALELAMNWIEHNRWSKR